MIASTSGGLRAVALVPDQPIYGPARMIGAVRAVQEALGGIPGAFCNPGPQVRFSYGLRYGELSRMQEVTTCFLRRSLGRRATPVMGRAQLGPPSLVTVVRPALCVSFIHRSDAVGHLCPVLPYAAGGDNGLPHPPSSRQFTPVPSHPRGGGRTTSRRTADGWALQVGNSGIHAGHGVHIWGLTALYRHS